MKDTFIHVRGKPFLDSNIDKNRIGNMFRNLRKWLKSIVKISKIINLMPSDKFSKGLVFIIHYLTKDNKCALGKGKR